MILAKESFPYLLPKKGTKIKLDPTTLEKLGYKIVRPHKETKRLSFLKISSIIECEVEAKVKEYFATKTNKLLIIVTLKNNRAFCLKVPDKLFAKQIQEFQDIKIFNNKF